MRYRIFLHFIILIILSSICPFLYGAGGHERLYYDYSKYINGKVYEIIETERNIKKIQKYTYYENGIIVIQVENPSKSVYICYNEYFNDSINSNIKLNEMIQLAYISYIGDEELSMNFSYLGNSIEINMEHSRVLSITEHKMVLIFDENTYRLKYINDIWTFSRFREEEYNYEYEYDSEGKLIGIYFIYDWGKVLKTAYYYDGVFRNIPRPYYLLHNVPNTDEIIIYDGDVLKYHLDLRTYVREAADRSTIEWQEGNIYYVIFEYDEYKNEINQESIYEKNDYYIKEDEIINHITENIVLDNYNNWTHIKVFRDNERIREVFRQIKYY